MGLDEIQNSWEKYMYSKVKVKERKNRIQTIENRLKISQEKMAESPTQENLANLESAKTEYEKKFDSWRIIKFSKASRDNLN